MSSSIITTAPSGGRRLLRRIIAEQRVRLISASALFISHQVGEVMVPVVAGLAIDRAVVNGDRGSLLIWLIVLAAVFAILSFSWRFGDRTMTRACEDAAHRLRLRVARHVLGDGALAGQRSTGEIASIAAGDVSGTVRILESIGAGAAGTAALLIAAIILLTISLTVGLVVLIGLPIVVVLLQLIVRPLEQRTDVQREHVALASTVAVDLLRGLRITKGLRAEGTAVDRYRSVSRRSLQAGLRASRFAAVHEGATVLVTGVFVAVVALIAGRAAAHGDVSIGDLVAAVGVTQFLIGPLWRIGFAFSSRARARACAARVASLLETPSRVTSGTTTATPSDTGVQLIGVHYRSLRHIDLDIAPGRFVAVVADKPDDAAALVDLLARANDPQAGSIRLGGVDFADLPLDQLRRAVVVSRHDAALFDGSVIDNLVTVDSRLTDESVSAPVLAAAGAADLAGTLPNGLHSAVGNRGERLSGGQRQRLALARALASDAPLLVVHDPTTAVDPFTEHEAARGMRAWRDGRTTIAVTTSPALLSVADEVIVIRDGVVASRGQHARLVNDDKRYAEAVLT